MCAFQHSCQACAEVPSALNKLMDDYHENIFGNRVWAPFVYRVEMLFECVYIMIWFLVVYRKNIDTDNFHWASIR